jgi:hypothetical protein
MYRLYTEKCQMLLSASKAKANAYRNIDLVNGTNYVDLNGVTIISYYTIALPVPTRDADMRNVLEYQGLTALTNDKLTLNSTIGQQTSSLTGMNFCFLQRSNFSFESR